MGAGNLAHITTVNLLLGNSSRFRAAFHAHKDNVRRVPNLWAVSFVEGQVSDPLGIIKDPARMELQGFFAYFSSGVSGEIVFRTPLNQLFQQICFTGSLNDGLCQLAPVMFFDLSQFCFCAAPRKILFVPASASAVAAEHPILPLDVLKCNGREISAAGQFLVLMLHIF